MSEQPGEESTPIIAPETDLRPGTDPNPPLPNTSPTDALDKTHFPADAFAGEPVAEAQFSDDAPEPEAPAAEPAPEPDAPAE
jgi:hypothetical protein